MKGSPTQSEANINQEKNVEKDSRPEPIIPDDIGTGLDRANDGLGIVSTGFEGAKRASATSAKNSSGNTRSRWFGYGKEARFWSKWFGRGGNALTFIDIGTKIYDAHQMTTSADTAPLTQDEEKTIFKNVMRAQMKTVIAAVAVVNPVLGLGLGLVESFFRGFIYRLVI